MNRTIPYSLGYQSITQNIGATRNTGIEVALSAITLDGWNGHPVDQRHHLVEEQERDRRPRRRRGERPRQPLVRRDARSTAAATASTATTSSTASGRRRRPLRPPKYGRRPGEIRIVDLNNDGRFNDQDKQILGNTYPSWTGSYSTRIDFKFLDFGAQAITRQGFMIQQRRRRAATRSPAATTA